MPEGLDDCVIELPGREIWLQIKSRKDAPFRDAEVRSFLAEMKRKGSFGQSIRFAVCLEQPRVGSSEHGVEALFEESPDVILACRSPEEEIIALFSSKLAIAPILIEGLVSDLYKLVAEAAAENASLSFKSRRRISAAEIECRVFERLEATDPSMIEEALASGVLAPVDFTRPIVEPGFYQGVKAKPGHVAAQLVVPRPKETQAIVDRLAERRCLLVTGPSGAGKSALVWLAGHNLSARCRLFRVSSSAGPQDVASIFRFVRSRRPREQSPMCLIFDDVGPATLATWNVAVREVSALPAVYLLGSIRSEDLSLVDNTADIALFEAGLDEAIAQNVWRQLANAGQTSWSHWQEPYEQSEGLMLEYVHILTRGARLRAVIEEQVRQRASEDRHEELAIIRCASAVCASGGEIEAKVLFNILRLSSEKAAEALTRLLREHLVRESRPGVLGGLHALRSAALVDASHDEVAFCRMDSFWKGLGATTRETRPAVIQAVLSNPHPDGETATLEEIGKLLATSDDVFVWSSTLTGLGLATLERQVTRFKSTLEKEGVPKAHWALSSLFAAGAGPLPKMSGAEGWEKIQKAVQKFRSSPDHDLRARCLEVMPSDAQFPECRNFEESNSLLAALAPIAGCEPLKFQFEPEFISSGTLAIRDLAEMLGTANLLGSNFAEKLVVRMGGEEKLLTLFKEQTPWVTAPAIEEAGQHGRTVRSNLHYIAEKHQPDPHETVCHICQTLIAISPRSQAAASEALDPIGRSISVGGMSPWSKDMPRENLPTKTRVAWNVAFRQIFLSRTAEVTLTDYASKMALLVTRTEKIFRSFSEKWIQAKKIANADNLAAEATAILQEVSTLSYATPSVPPASMTAPADGAAREDALGALLAAVLGNLMRRMSNVPGGKGNKGVAGFADDLAAQARSHAKSEIWRVLQTPPIEKLAALEGRLKDVSEIVHEMSHDTGPDAISSIVKAAKGASLGKGIKAAARHCRQIAEQRLRNSLLAVEGKILEHGWKSKCYVRVLADTGSHHWPLAEIAVLVNISDFTKDAEYLNAAFQACQQYFGDSWRYRVAPVIQGRVVGALAMMPAGHMTPDMQDLNFADGWETIVSMPFLVSSVSDAFDRAMGACSQISGIMNARGVTALHPEEDAALAALLDLFTTSRKELESREAEAEEFRIALAYVDDGWSHILEEYRVIKAGAAPEDPLCDAPYQALAGQVTDRVLELAAFRILLRQAECAASPASG